MRSGNLSAKKRDLRERKTNVKRNARARERERGEEIHDARAPALCTSPSPDPSSFSDHKKRFFLSSSSSSSLYYV